MPRRNQVLLLDADDTLWENNVYFERAIARFLDQIERAAPAGFCRAAARECINGEERRVILEVGYGLESFRLAISRAYQALAPGAWDAAAEAAVLALAEEIAREPIVFVQDAVETLHYLSARHRLLLMTKGDFAEQTRKIELSGLGPLFERVCVLPEKDEAAYRAVLPELQAPPEQCWMIGNSPKSDINPALAAGLNAVFIPHAWTWVLEAAEIQPHSGRHCLHLERIADLRRHF